MPPRVKPKYRASVERLLEQINGEVAALPEATIRELAPILFEAQQELARDLQSWLRDAEDAEARFTAQRLRAALVQIDSALQKVAEIEPEMAAALAKGGHRAGVLAFVHLKREFAAWAPEFEGSVSPLPFNVAGIIARGDRMLIPRFRTSAARYAGAVGDDIRRQLALGMVRGETFHEMTDRLVRLGGPRGVVSLRGVLGEPGAVSEHIAEGLFKRYRYWASRVVRTEVVEGYNTQADEGISECHKIDDEIKRKWCASLDARICLSCREMDGQVVEVGKPFKGGVEHPPLHPNCFPAGTRVLTAGGWCPIERVAVGDLVRTHRSRWRRILGLSRRRYVGDLVRISAGAHIVATTPNHQFATPQGWVEAERLGVERAEVLALAQGLPAVPQNAPPAQCQHGLLGGVLAHLARRRVPVSTVDLDRDHRRRYGDVDVELLDGQVDDDVEAQRSQTSGDDHLVLGVRATLADERPTLQFGQRALVAAHRGMRRLRLMLALLWGEAGHAPRRVLSWRALDPGRLEDALDRCAAAPVATRQRHRGVSGQVEGDDLGSWQVEWEHNDMVQCHPALSREPFDGDVFNFEVADDESYIAEGFVVHNCRCAVVAWRDDWADDGEIAAKAQHKKRPPEERSDPATAPVESSPPATRPPPGRRTPLDQNALKQLENATKFRPPERGDRFDNGGFADQAAIRATIDGIVERFGPTKKSRRLDNEIGVFKYRRGRDNGTCDIMTGRIEVCSRRARALRGFVTAMRKGEKPTDLQVSSFRTVVHETIHAHAAIGPRAYRGAGRVVEEVTTEVAARKIVRDTFNLADREVIITPLDPTFVPYHLRPELPTAKDFYAAHKEGRIRSYDERIISLRSIVERHATWAPARAAAEIEEAAFAMRKSDEVIDDVVGYVRHFTRNLPVEENVREAIGRDILSKWGSW